MDREIRLGLTYAAFDARDTHRPDGSIAVEAHQVVRGLDGTLLDEGDVRHVYVFRGDLVARMDVEEPTSSEGPGCGA